MKIVLLDSLSIINRAFYALPMSLTDGEGRIINAVYGYFNMLAKIIREHKPTHIAAAFDLKAPTFRHKMYDGYKATRSATPPELLAQIPIIKELLLAMNIEIVEKEGFEADDIIGTLSKRFDVNTIIVTGDKDSFQLIDESTNIWYKTHSFKDVLYNIEKLKEDDKLTPQQIIEYKALMGDKSDNIPGIVGFGDKTVMPLLKQFGNIDNIYANIDNIDNIRKKRDKLIENKEIVYLSKKLATIDINVPIDVTLEQLKFNYPFEASVEEEFRKLKFKSLLDKFEFKKPIIASTSKTVIIEKETELKEILKRKSDIFAINFTNYTVDFAYDNLTNYHIILKDDFLTDFYYNTIVSKFKDVLESGIQLIVYSNKSYKYLIKDEKIKYNDNVFDLSLASYVVDCNNKHSNINDLISTWSFDDSMIATAMIQIREMLLEKLQENSTLTSIYQDIELPLSNVLYDMERAGFKVDNSVLKKLNDKYDLELVQLSQDIYSLAGEEFNINSPQQLGKIIFEKLALAKGKKTKTGYSTTQEILESLIDKHPMIPLILRYRFISKLNSTYCIGLAKLIDQDGKIRTCFMQSLTQTGRLSSKDPNLQNIPVREKEGRELRKAFIASDNCKLVVADYSQIELRLLAHCSQDRELLTAYNSNKDIHAYTASLVHGVDLSAVTPEMRSAAKAVNFGIIYGISDFGLSTTIGIPVYKAKEFIKRYFEAYPSVWEYMQKNVELAKEKGYAETIFGRQRKIIEINSSNYNLRSFGERVAMNMPLQGSAADIIKIAMIKVYNALKCNNYKAKLIMQIHDELIIDTPINEVDKVKALLRQCMEDAVKLSVPLPVSLEVGDNWFEAK